MSKELEAWKNLLEGYDKTEDVIYFVDKDKLDTIEVALNKCEQYKASEEELGIDLLTLIKANNDGAYFKEDLRYYIANIDLKHKCVRLIKHYEAEDDFDCHYVMFKEYGKTWALTREELE